MNESTTRLAVRAYAVTGALLFVASLASGIWLYIVLGRAADPAVAPGVSLPHRGGSPTWLAIAIDVLLFGLFAAHHSLLARSGAKIVLTRTLPPALERSTYVWLASLLFLAVTLGWQPVSGVAYTVGGPLAWVLYAIQLCGVLLTLEAARALDPRELAGLQQAWRYGTPAASTLETLEARVVTFTSRGAYGLVRHPIYLGWFMMVWASPRMTWGRVTFAIVSSAYLLLAIPWEEHSLATRHGDHYARYRAAVRWRVLPGLY